MSTRLLGTAALAAVALLLGACTATDSAPPEPTIDAAALEAVDGVVAVGLEGGGRPVVRVQLDDLADPSQLGATASEVRDLVVADDGTLGDRYLITFMIVRPGDYPASVRISWSNVTQDDADLAGIVATAAAYRVPPSGSGVIAVLSEGYQGGADVEWRLETLSIPDDAIDTELRAALAEAALEVGLDLAPHRIGIERGFPGQ